jgi:NAD-dependent SIR2 family protein deacetylase
MDDINAAIEAADIFVAIGTSGVVYPAASFARSCPRWWCRWPLIGLP